MKKKKLLSLVCAFLLLTGCSASPATDTAGQSWDAGWMNIGTKMGIEAPESLTLLENKEALAADGLYYATWVDGDSVPYENSDGDTVDLYDAQLYLLVSERNQEEEAQKNRNTWLAAAKENYDVLSEQEITCHGQTYSMISYNCIGRDTPYSRGVSAFSACGVNAVCAELTCLKTYKGDLEELLTEFLEGCHYSAG